MKRKPVDCRGDNSTGLATSQPILRAALFSSALFSSLRFSDSRPTQRAARR